MTSCYREAVDGSDYFSAEELSLVTLADSSFVGVIDRIPEGFAEKLN